LKIGVEPPALPLIRGTSHPGKKKKQTSPLIRGVGGLKNKNK